MDELFKPADFNIGIVMVGEGEYLPRHVVCAACQWEDGLIVTGVRHFCPIMRAQIARMDPKPQTKHEQGFVDQWGNFMSRDEALTVVKMNKQPLRHPHDEWETLYSENLY